MRNYHHLFFLVILLFGWGFCSADDFLGYPLQFQIRQDHGLRLFHITQNELFLGAVVSSDWGVLEFYDGEKKQQYLNEFNNLYDNQGSLVASILIVSDNQWFPPRSTAINLYSGSGDFLAHISYEEPTRSFVIRDPETAETLAFAVLVRGRSNSRSISTKFGYEPKIPWYSLQDWSVTILNPARLQEKNIPAGFLVWTLLKHSQKLLPGPNEQCQYLQDYADDAKEGDATVPWMELASEKFPDQFFIRQEPGKRRFCITDEEKLLNVVVNSAYKKFDFYDDQQNRLGLGRVDSLYENSGHCMGFVTMAPPITWLYDGPYMTLYAANESPVAYIDEEGDDGTFVFRDVKTQQPFAVAKWNCLYMQDGFFSWYTYDQEWSVTLLDRTYLQKNGIPVMNLIWTLLMHSRIYLPWLSTYEAN